VEYERGGEPRAAYIVARLNSNGHRVLANEVDEDTLKRLASTTEEQIGKTGYVMRDTSTEGRSLFGFKTPDQSKL
jgi:hypothetical protein